MTRSDASHKVWSHNSGHIKTATTFAPPHNNNNTNSIKDTMSEITDKPKRKSVAFSEGNTIVDSEGKITEEMANGGDDKTTAESHSGEPSGDAAVDEVTDMFKDLAKKKKKKPKKEDDGEGGEKAADDGDDIDLGALKKKKKKKSSKTAELDDFDKQLAEAGEAGEAAPEEDVDVDAGDPIQGMLPGK